MEPKQFTPKVLNLKGQGLTMLLGELEARVLELVWQHTHYTGVSIRELCGYLASDGKHLSFNTVMTVANRMIEKGLLYKEKGLGPYLYYPVEEREVFWKRMGELTKNRT